MEKFEYYTWCFETDGFFGIDQKKLNQQLNKLGSQGWELVTGTPTLRGNGVTYTVIYVFKRRLAE